MLFLASVLTAWLACAPVARAAVYYAGVQAAPITNPMNFTCTEDNPCLLTDVLSNAAENDTISMLSGNYVGNFKINKAGLTLQTTSGTVRFISDQKANGDDQEVGLTISAPRVSVLGPQVRLGPVSSNSGLRDIGVLITPESGDVLLDQVTIRRDASRKGYEPDSGPGSCGLLVMNAPGVTMRRSFVYGPFQDSIYLPTSQTEINGNVMDGAQRIGLVVVQEPGGVSTGHVISNNNITNFGVDGIQIQGDQVSITDNTVIAYLPGSDAEDSDNTNTTKAMYGIHICGANVTDDLGNKAVCVDPWSESQLVEGITLSENTVLGVPENLTQALVAPDSVDIAGALVAIPGMPPVPGAAPAVGPVAGGADPLTPMAPPVESADGSNSDTQPPSSAVTPSLAALAAFIAAAVAFL